MNKILIAGGSLKSENRGINALTRGTLKGIYDFAGDHVHVKLLSFIVREKCSIEFRNNGKTYIIEEIPFRLKDNARLLLKQVLFRLLNIDNTKQDHQNETYNIYSEANLVLDLTAGDSFTDIYGVLRYLYVSMPKLISILMKKKLILMPQTIGPFKYGFVKLMSKYIINNCHISFARDKVSYAYLLNDLKVEKTKAALSPDLAFNMPPSKEALIGDIIGYSAENSSPLIGINISGLLYNGGYNGKNQFGLIIDYKELIERIINYFINKNCRIILVPHVINSMEDYEDDASVCRKKADDFGKNYSYIFSFKKEYMEDQIKAIIGKCDFFIGSRMHSCIGAISMGVPAVPVAYSRKFIGIWDEYGMKDCVADAKTMNIEEIMNKIDYCFNNRIQIRNMIHRELKNVKEEINSIFELIMDASRSNEKFDYCKHSQG